MSVQAAVGGAAVARQSDYPADLQIEYPEHSSRLKLLVRGFLLIPHWFMLSFYVLGASFALVWVQLSVLFTGRYPEGAYRYLMRVMRWTVRVKAYRYMLAEQSPPYGGEEDAAYPVHVQAGPPQDIARWRPLVVGLLVMPAALISGLISLGGFFVSIVSWLGILFTGRHPEGAFRYLTVSLRWTVRVRAYAWLMTDQYPPFIWG